VVTLQLQGDVDMDRAQRPLLALRVHPQRDRCTRAERGTEDLMRGGAEVLAARRDTLVSCELMPAGEEPGRVLLCADVGRRVCHVLPLQLAARVLGIVSGK